MKDEIPKSQVPIDTLLRSCGEEIRTHLPNGTDALFAAKKEQALREVRALQISSPAGQLPGFAWLAMPRVAVGGAIAACIAMLLLNAPMQPKQGQYHAPLKPPVVTASNREVPAASHEAVPDEADLETADSADDEQLNFDEEEIAFADMDLNTEEAREVDMQAEDSDALASDDTITFETVDSFLTDATGDYDDYEEGDIV